MASNDGRKLTIFGLTHRQHDTRSMQRILREYGRLPETPGDRAGLFVALTSLAKELDEEKSSGIENWLQNGGEFPSPNTSTLGYEFGRRLEGSVPEPSQTSQSLYDFPNLRDHPRHPQFPPLPPIGRGLLGMEPRAHPGAFMRGNQPGVAHMSIPGPFMGHGHPGFDSRPSSRYFMGAGRSLVDTNAVDPVFPTANPSLGDTPSSTFPTEYESANELPDQWARTDLSHPVAEDMQEISHLQLQRRQRQRPRVDGEDIDRMDIVEPIGNEVMNEVFGRNWVSASDDDEDDDEDQDMDEISDIGNPHRGSRHPLEEIPSMMEQIMAHADEAIPKDDLECCICTNSLPPANFPESPNITSTCNHEDANVLVCLSCIEQSIRAPIDDGIINLITCPLCPEKLSNIEIKLYASERIFARYQYLLMSLNPNMVFCLGRDCGIGQLHSIEELGSVMTCDKCSFKTCVRHKLPWHEGMTCEEFDGDESQIERLEQEEATARLLAKLASKICPTCKQGVDRSAGCDHLRCRCGGEWCFECMASWENILRIGATAHATTCPNHPNRVQLRADQKRANEAKILESVHGGKVSEVLQKARVERDARNRERIRPLALEAAERRAKEDAMARQALEEQGSAIRKQKKTKLIAPWEEK